MTSAPGVTALLDDSHYFLNLLTKNIKLIDATAVKILAHQLFYIKRHISPDFFHYVIEHRLTLELAHGLKRRFRVYTISFSHHGRRSTYEAMRLIYHNKFGQGDIIIPTPLWYEQKIMALFYLGVPGDTLLEHLKNGHLQNINFQKIARGLKRIHATTYAPGQFKLHEFSLPFLDPTAVLDRPHNRHDPLRARVLAQLENLERLQRKIVKTKPCLSHGDLHPENIIINKFDSSRLAIIDFSEVCLAPKFYDVASFLVQLQLMSLGYLEQKKYLTAEKIFLENYFGPNYQHPNLQNNLYLYQAWTALKNAIFAMIFIEPHNRHYAGYLIDLSQELSQKIK